MEKRFRTEKMIKVIDKVIDDLIEDLVTSDDVRLRTLGSIIGNGIIDDLTKYEIDNILGEFNITMDNNMQETEDLILISVILFSILTAKENILEEENNNE